MREKHKEVLKMAKGFRGRAKNCWTVASNKVEKSLQHAYVGRKLKKREFRTLWIEQINAGVRQHDMKYSHFIHALSSANVQLNRKVLADLAVFEPFSFKAVVETARLGAGASGELK